MGSGRRGQRTGSAVRVRLCQLVLAAVSRSPQAVQVSAEDVRWPQLEWMTNMCACSDGAGRCFSAQITTALSTGSASSPFAVSTYSWRVRPPSSYGFRVSSPASTRPARRLVSTESATPSRSFMASKRPLPKKTSRSTSMLQGSPRMSRPRAMLQVRWDQSDRSAMRKP